MLLKNNFKLNKKPDKNSPNKRAGLWGLKRFRFKIIKKIHSLLFGLLMNQHLRLSNIKI